MPAAETHVRCTAVRTGVHQAEQRPASTCTCLPPSLDSAGSGWGCGVVPRPFQQNYRGQHTSVTSNEKTVEPAMYASVNTPTWGGSTREFRLHKYAECFRQRRGEGMLLCTYLYPSKLTTGMTFCGGSVNTAISAG
jgi:hypothetical protein